jgi:protein MpaA
VADEAPASASVELGRSVDGVPLTMEVIGDGSDRVLVVGGTHGDEPTGAIVASRLARFLHDHPELLAGRTVAVLARVNPDGLLGQRRVNARGVDLNRNFPSTDWQVAEAGRHGQEPASEPETLAVMRAVEIVRPLRIVDIHSIAPGHQCNNYDGPGERLAELMSRSNGYPVLASVGYATPGALGNWAGIDRGIPTITLELPRGASGRESWRENSAALLAFIEAGDHQAAR